MSEKILSLAEAATRLGVATQTLRIQAKTGRLRATKVGPIWTTTEEAVEEYRERSLGRYLAGSRKEETK